MAEQASKSTPAKAAPAAGGLADGALNADPKADPSEQVVRRDQLDVVDPAAQALTGAREAKEREELEAQRDELRKRLGDSASSLPALRAEVQALEAAAARAGAFAVGPMSAGVHADLVARGYAVGDHGETYVVDGDRVKVTERGTGRSTMVDMPQAPKLTEEQTGVKAGRISGQK